MKKLNGEVIEAVRVGESDAGRIVGGSLKALRELAGLTQAQMARRLGIGQAAISKIEHRGDVQISSLQRYVEALGAELRIDAAFPRNTIITPQLRGAFENELSDENQLVFPILGDETFPRQRDVVLSIRPQFSQKILHGVKTVELRRRFPMSAPPGTIAYIYCTSPVQALVGRAEIKDVVKLSIVDIWKRFAEAASIEQSDFDNYFHGLSEGFAIKIENAKPMPRHLKLSELRHRFGFEPPQSFLYANPALRRALQDECADLSH